MFRIIIIEDEKSTRQELSALLSNALYEVVCIEEFDHIPEQIIEASPDLVLLDMNLPGSNGFFICKEVCKSSEVPIIFVTGSRSPMDELSGMLLGGDDYITKPYQPPILLARIAAVLKRTAKERKEENFRFTRNGVTLDIPSAMLEAGDRRMELSKNELKILHFLFRQPGVFVARTDLIDYLWDESVFIDDNTLSVNMTRIRGKLEQIGIQDFIETKRGLGYKIR